MEEFSSGVMVRSKEAFCFRFLSHTPWHHSLIAEDGHVHTGIVIFARHASCTFFPLLAGSLLYTSGWLGLVELRKKDSVSRGGSGRKRSDEMRRLSFSRLTNRPGNTIWLDTTL
jgi:hypothetical protein